MAEIGGAVAGRVADSLFAVVKKEIGYMWNCTQNVDTLKRTLQDLKGMRERVQGQIDIAIRKGDRLLEGVEKWMKDADEEISKAEEFVEEEGNAKKTCFKIAVCGNWHTLHRYGRRATNLATSLLQTQGSGTPYESCVCVETPAPGPLDVYQNKHLDDLHTHNSALEDIIKSLEDESKQIVGIYGLGGVGKTTLAMEVAARVKNLLFADVAFTTVSQTVNAEKIQKDLENATKRIKKGDKILIILDDVWENLNLEGLCIPCGNNYVNCKILLTSRSEKVCQKMNAQSKICVNTLRTEEAWTLFKRVVGERLEADSNLKPVALKVVEECGGLPLLIQAVGNALKDESIESWELALTQLQKHAPSNMDDEIRKSFTHLKLSYDYLRSEEAKSCFLLCSLWYEDQDILLEDLVTYLVGLGKFDDLDSMWEARSRVQNAVNILTSSGLLLNSKEKGSTKMHDVVRDVALLIASQGNNKFLVKAGQGLTEWLPRNINLESYTGISLMGNRIIKLPDYRVNVPHLEIFLVDSNLNLSIISDEFIGCMKKVKVLDISWNDISSLPQSFQLLTKLRTLDLGRNKFFREISILGKLKDLEILILNRTGITEIPKEIAQLVNLRVLEFRECDNLSLIAHGVISALWRLEELCIDLRGMSEGVDACIIEVVKLLKLTYLDLSVKSFDLFPEGFNLKNLKGFVVQIGTIYLGNPPLRSDRYFIISKVHLVNRLVKWSNKLIEGSHPIIILCAIDNLNNFIPNFYHQGLKEVRIVECDDVSCLVDDSTTFDWDERKTEEKFFKELENLRVRDLNKLEVLWKCPDEYISLTSLVSIRVGGCPKLKRVFTVRVAKDLVNLRKLEIKLCSGLEEVIWGGNGGGGDDESGNVIVFPSLVEIFFDELEKLKRFFNSAGNYSMEYPSLVEVEIRRCERMGTWGPGIHKTTNLKALVRNDNVLEVDGPCAINEAVDKSWRMWSQVDDDNDYDDNE